MADIPTRFSDEHLEGDLYTKYTVTIDYLTPKGKIQVPVASEDPRFPSEIVVVCSEVTQKIVTWVAEREGSKPKIPDPTPQGSNLVLLSTRISPVSPILDVSGQVSSYRITGVYVYALIESPDPIQSNLDGSSSPWTNIAKEENAVEPSQFTTEII